MAGNTILGQLRQEAPLITVGVLTADMMCLREQLGLIEKAGVKLLHFDVMDGCFCPLLTMGPPFIKAVKTALVKDVHLMIEDPLEKLEAYVQAGADMLTVNVESCRHLHQALKMIGEMENANDAGRGIVRGVSLNPSTPIEAITSVIDQVEMVLLLAVNPGWGGQTLAACIADKIAAVKAMANKANRDILICVDGGVKKNNIADVTALGADIIVTGSAVFDGKTPGENAEFMIQAVKQTVANR